MLEIPNLDERVIEDFGDEWATFDQRKAREEDLRTQFDSYFKLFPWEDLPEDSIGVDVGCGSGRWDRYLAPQVGHLHCCDPSIVALDVARRSLTAVSNVSFHDAGVDSLPFEDESMDFCVSLGVLHHVPDTGEAIKECARILKPGAPMLLYLYYDFENRPLWFRMIWKCSDLLRRGISRLPFWLKYSTTTVIAATVYLPLAKTSRLLELLGVRPGTVDLVPLASYRRWSFYCMRTDALDRFGTRLERRFSKREIEEMMVAADIADVRFKEGRPMWTVVGRKRAERRTRQSDMA